MCGCTRLDGCILRQDLVAHWGHCPFDFLISDIVVPNQFVSFYVCRQGLSVQFEQLALAPGQSPVQGEPADSGPNHAAFPRPLGADASVGEAPPVLDQHSCDPGYLRPTTSCVPNSAALSSRCHSTPSLQP